MSAVCRPSRARSFEEIGVVYSDSTARYLPHRAHGAATLVQAAARGLRHRRIPPEQLGHVRFPVAVLRTGSSATSTVRQWFRIKMDQAVIPYLEATCLYSEGVLVSGEEIPL